MANSTSAHASHILPLKVYFRVFGALLVLTVITVAVAMVDLGDINLIVAMFIAAIKASLVALFFMHLKYDNKLYALVFVSALLFLAAFVVFTMIDTESRGDVTPEEGMVINKEAVIYRQKPAATAADSTGDHAMTSDSTANTANSESGTAHSTSGNATDTAANGTKGDATQPEDGH